jgi:UDP-N-acetylmuramyl pentapeptide phosphotransferase/UDP-N-acetylglucosamine-1-phosphate transferase
MPVRKVLQKVKTNTFLPASLILVQIAIAAAVGGTVGVVMVILMLFGSYNNWILDRSYKHGISEENSSRFGGVIVFFGVICFIVAHGSMIQKDSLLETIDFRFYFRGYEWVALLAGTLGLWEDYAERLSPALRLQLLSVLVAGFYFAHPNELPSSIFPSEFPQFLNNASLVGLGVVICVVGFINAGNVADGANGLLSGIAIVVFSVAYLETGTLIFFFLVGSIFLFTVVNTTTGLMFLGDFGSYSISALMALTCVDLYSQGNSSVWFYACLVAYPCVELVRAMLGRWRRGAPIMKADNMHLHNILFELFKSVGLNSLLANSCTGIAIAAASSLIPLGFYLSGWVEIDSRAWMLLFSLYCFFHFILYRAISRRI